MDGWITKALPNTTGSFVKNNEILAVFYSPEFVAAAQGLFVALSAADRTKPSSKGTPLQMDQLAGFKLNIQQYLDSLKNLGMSDLQIERMTKTREWYQNVDLVSPADGLILARNVSNGLRFTKGTELYRIADLRRVWILADVYGNEAHYFKPGVEARVTLPDRGSCLPGQGRPRSPRPLTPPPAPLRSDLETDNPGSILRPDMFVRCRAYRSPMHRRSPFLPTPSWIRGEERAVFIDRGNGFFEPREVRNRLAVWGSGRDHAGD